MPETAKTPPAKTPSTDEKHRKKGTPPAAGPHAKPDLTDKSKTPGSGMLPDPDKPHEGDVTSG